MLMGQIMFTSWPGVVGMGMGNYCAVNRSPWINVKIASVAVNAFICKCKQLSQSQSMIATRVVCLLPLKLVSNKYKPAG